MGISLTTYKRYSHLESVLYDLKYIENKLFKSRTDYLKRFSGYSGAVLWKSLPSFSTDSGNF